MSKHKPIGVFDSGFGGLTVLKAVADQLPREDIVYLGDTARVPYGTRSTRTVARYAQSCARFLAAQDIKCLVVACNTVSAVALDILSVSLDVPVMGVIQPGAAAAVNASASGRIGVVATVGTVGSGAYVRAVAAYDTRAEVFAQAAPLWVPLVEEGWTEGPLPSLAVERYLGPLLASNIDVLLLGCTHYPVLRPAIEQFLADRGYAIPVIDGGGATAHELRKMLQVRDLLRHEDHTGKVHVQVTDTPNHFEDLMKRFVGDAFAVGKVSQVDL